MVHSVAEGQEVEVKKGRFEASKNSDGVQIFSIFLVQECIPTKPKAIEIFQVLERLKVVQQIAKKIVQKHLTNTIHMLDNSIDELLDIPGITDKNQKK